MNIMDWPQGIYPRSQKFFLAHKTKSAESAFTGQRHVSELAGTRWVAEFEFVLNQPKARIMDALIASLRGGVGEIYVPDFRRLDEEVVPDSMDAYAEEIGTTFFDDRYDFDDESNEEGLLVTEESSPLGMEGFALLGSGFDIPVVFPSETELETEAGLALLWDGIALELETDKGFILTLEHGAPLEIAIEEGFVFETQDDESLPVQVGGGFFEGEGTPEIFDGAGYQLKAHGLAPFREILSAGDGITAEAGRGYLILNPVTTDIDGTVAIPIMPKLRGALETQALKVGMVKVLMRLRNDESALNPVGPRMLTSYTLQFEEILK